MRTVLLGALIGAALMLAASSLAADRSVVPPPVPAATRAALPEGQLIGVPLSKVSEQVQQFVVLDPRSRVLAVYQIDLHNGESGLQSVRKIDFDLQMESFNTKVPLPQEVQSYLDSLRR